jgi:hypothetical protein
MSPGNPGTDPPRYIIYDTMFSSVGVGGGLGSEPVDSEQGIVRVAPGGPTDLTNDRPQGSEALTTQVQFLCI